MNGKAAHFPEDDNGEKVNYKNTILSDTEQYIIKSSICSYISLSLKVETAEGKLLPFKRVLERPILRRTVFIVFCGW